MRKRFLLGFLAVAVLPKFVNAQAITKEYNVITTAVPFITLSPDSKAASMGDAGVASTPDANSVFWNTAKLAFSEQKMGASVSYAPWLKELIGDMFLVNASAYRRLGENQTITGGFTLFNQGLIEFTTDNGQSAGSFQSKEFVFTLGLAQKLNENFSMGLNVKYINSNLVGNNIINNTAGKPGRTGAFDLGFYYNRNAPGDERATDISYGVVFQNIGGKINYGFNEYYIPANLKIGTKISHLSGEHNNFTFLLDFNKLLVPSTQSDGTISKKSSLSGVFSSFSDAPGGFSEELKEITASLGAEYSYDRLFALRTGYFYENAQKGGRRYVTSGMGINFKELYNFDLAYLIPVNSGNPLANTWRITLSANIP